MRLLSLRVYLTLAVSGQSQIRRGRRLVALADPLGASSAVAAAALLPCALGLNVSAASVTVREVSFDGVAAGAASITVSWAVYAVISAATNATSLVYLADLGAAAGPAVAAALQPFLSSDAVGGGGSITPPVVLVARSSSVGDITVAILPSASGIPPVAVVPLLSPAASSGSGSPPVAIVAACVAVAVVCCAALIAAAVILKKRRHRAMLTVAQQKFDPRLARGASDALNRGNPLHDRQSAMLRKQGVSVGSRVAGSTVVSLGHVSSSSSSGDGIQRRKSSRRILQEASGGSVGSVGRGTGSGMMTENPVTRRQQVSSVRMLMVPNVLACQNGSPAETTGSSSSVRKPGSGGTPRTRVVLLGSHLEAAPGQPQAQAEEDTLPSVDAPPMGSLMPAESIAAVNEANPISISRDLTGSTPALPASQHRGRSEPSSDGQKTPGPAPQAGAAGYEPTHDRSLAALKPVLGRAKAPR